MAYVPKAWKVGEPMVNEKHFDNNTQTRLFHQLYLQQVKRGRLMFGFQYKHQHFYHGDGEQWIMRDGMYGLLKGGELGAQMFVGIVSRMFIFFMNYHVVDTIECLNLFYMPMQNDDEVLRG
jgi:hypothetical protein